MTDYEQIHFAYYPSEADIRVVAWYLRQLDRKLSKREAKLQINDMKFGRAGLEISWDLLGDQPEELENEIESDISWVCRKAAKGVR